MQKWCDFMVYRTLNFIPGNVSERVEMYVIVMATWPSGLRRRLKEVPGMSRGIPGLIRRSSGVGSNPTVVTAFCLPGRPKFPTTSPANGLEFSPSSLMPTIFYA
ncbi:hypothetical protein PGT21_022753 [Puccinia graminis f. sp. tritici]|uniref:Uncharacterized protein n=1 Tax=Puccinia graminis f. sp. tritici TaxID=56615 RepID=A0A5B0QNN1_PUCGR|nr:hypothetical protein PGT21_022753 [Puccinia graminis f. sp. tritici]